MSLSFGRRDFLVVAAALPTLALAQAGGKKIDAGIDYTVVEPPQPTETPGKIEVLEFFWYGCPHCAAFDPELSAWRKRLPSYVAYRRNPVAFSDAQTPHSKIYYALEALGKEDAMHAKVFAQIVGNRKPMLKTDEIADFMAANGIDRKQWLDIYNSFTVATRAARAAQVWRAYKVDGTPTVGVDGRFITSPAQASGRAECLRVLDFLIQRVYSEKGAMLKK
ncbi:MAG: thiol:disulfide interchange protein DsbA/DsbL [Gemmatimonadota bacterium]